MEENFFKKIAITTQTILRSIQNSKTTLKIYNQVNQVNLPS